MKILQVVHGFPPRQYGSIENYAFALSKELSRDHEVAAYTRNSDFTCPDYSESEEWVDGIRVRRINNRLQFPHYYDYNNNLITKSFRKFLGENKPDMVHVHHLKGLSASTIRVANDLNIPVVMTLHDYWLLCRRMSLLRPNSEVCSGPGAKKCQDCRYREIERLILPSLARVVLQHIPETLIENVARNRARWQFQGSDSWADKYLTGHISRTSYLQMIMNRVAVFISPSKFVKELFSNSGVPRRKIVCVPHGLPGASVGNPDKKPSDRLRFGYMGTVDWHKGVHVLVEAFNELSAEPVDLRICGAAPSTTYLNFLKSINRNERTEFLGPYADSKSALSEIDVLVIPSVFYESFSLVMREAFLTRTPVIASRIGALPEGIDEGVNGLLFEPGNAKDLLSKIRFLLENPRAIRAMSDRSPTVKAMSEHAKEIEEIYKTL